MGTATVPHHLAIIMDGNRRWARSRGLPAFVGHKRGADVLERIGEVALRRGVKILTVWAFSTENWKRSKREITFLMKLLLTLRDRMETFVRWQVQVLFTGRTSEFPQDVQDAIAEVARKTRHFKKGILNIALNYGGRTELVDAVRAIAQEGIRPSRITADTITAHLYRPTLPDPDLIIRTGGEMRLSGFLPWEGVYSELYFTEKRWPEFTVRDLDAAFRSYTKRDRRYGGN